MKKALLATAVALLVLAPVVGVEAVWWQVQAEVEARGTVQATTWSPFERRMLGVEREGVFIEEVVWTPREPRKLVLLRPRIDAAALGGVGGEDAGEGQDVTLVVEDAALVWGDEPLADGFSGVLGEALINDEGAYLGPGRRLGMTLPFPHEAVIGDVGLSIDATGEVWDVVAEGSWKVKHPLLSKRTLTLPPARLQLLGDPRSAATGTLVLGDIEVAVQVEGTVIHASLEPTDAMHLLQIVEDIVPELEHAEVRGTLGGSASYDRHSGDWTLEPHIEGLAVQGAVKNLEGLRWGQFSYRAWDAEGDPVVRASGEGSPDWTPLRDVSPHLPAAIIAAEDSAFLRHDGYDPKAISAAIEANQQAEGVVRGGSTLTQQLAKNLFLSGERTVERKLRELLLAVELDRALGKDRVMELYVNVVEWGPEIWGIHQATDTYFARRPATLPANEAAFLAAILPSPRTFYTDWYLRGRAGSFKMDWVLTNMADGKHFSHAAANAAKARPLRFVPPPE